jgi:hypothetical protein
LKENGGSLRGAPIAVFWVEIGDFLKFVFDCNEYKVVNNCASQGPEVACRWGRKK